jgi:hypothetical protein
MGPDRQTASRTKTASRTETASRTKAAFRTRAVLISIATAIAGAAPAQAQETPSTTEPAPTVTSPGSYSGTGSAADASGDAIPSAAAIEEATMGGKTKQKRNGIVAYLSLTGRYTFITPDASTTLTNTGLQGGLFGGYKIDRFTFGLFLDIQHIGTSSQQVAGNNQSSGSRGDTSFLIGPGFQGAILRSKDHRIELIGTFQMGFGRTVTSTSNDPEIPGNYRPENNTSNFHLAYSFGPGLRYWAHPQFALTLASGFAADHVFFKQDNPSGLRADQLNLVSMYGTLGALGVF